MIPRLWTCKELALIAAIVVLACGAAFLSIRLTRPKPFAQRDARRRMAVQAVVPDHGLPQDRSRRSRSARKESRLGCGKREACGDFLPELVEPRRRLRPPAE